MLRCESPKVGTSKNETAIDISEKLEVLKSKNESMARLIKFPKRTSLVQTNSTDNLIRERRDTFFSRKQCCSNLYDNLYFLCAQIKAKFKDDLLIGQEHSKRILPDCNSPSQNLLAQKNNLD